MASSYHSRSVDSSRTPHEIHIKKCRRWTGRTHGAKIAKCVKTLGFEDNCTVFWDATVLSNANQIAVIAVTSIVLHGGVVCYVTNRSFEFFVSGNFTDVFHFLF